MEIQWIKGSKEDIGERIVTGPRWYRQFTVPSFYVIPMDPIPPNSSLCTTAQITANWSDQVLENVDFSGCRFLNCVFERTVFQKCTFEDCEFESSDLSLASIAGSSFNSVLFRNCRLRGIHWHQAGFSFDAQFLDSKLDYSSFFGMKLNKIRFSGSSLKEVAFVDAVAREAKFDRCDLVGAAFNHTDLGRADFTGARNYTIDVTNNQVKGAMFDLPEAVSLLSFLGIKIR